MSNFDDKRSGTGTNEWSERTENIQRGCSHNCLYCYASSNAVRFKLRDRNDWEREELTKKAFITSYPQREGVIMFPSAHDITPPNVEHYIRVATLMLEKGNRLLIVSKPHLECVAKMCDAFEAFRDQILFRFTIGTMNNDVAAHWEPGAPPPSERVDALKLAFDLGYRTSISAEPLLGGTETAVTLMDAVRPYVTDTVWIGKMNKIRKRVDMTAPGNLAHAEEIEAAQTDAEVLRMVSILGADPLVRWKDSVEDVMIKSGCESKK